MLVNSAVLAREAAVQGVGIGAFNVILLEQAEAIVAAAEATKLPVILQVSENAVRYHRGRLAPMASALRSLGETAAVPIGLHLDHAESTDLCREALTLGFTSIMYDGSRLSDTENRRSTAEMVSAAHAQGIAVEAELGEIGGKNGVHDPSARTNPEDAARFVADTGVDMLAVAVGSSHAMATRDAVLDSDLIAHIHKLVPVPLVLHGSSGVPDAGIQSAIRAGMTKINVSTHLNGVFTAEVRKVLSDSPHLSDPRKYLSPAATAMEEETARLQRVFALQL